MDINKKVGQNIRAARRAVKMRQAELGDRIGLPQTRVSQLERGNINMRLSQLCAIAEALNVSPLALLEGDK